MEGRLLRFILIAVAMAALSGIMWYIAQNRPKFDWEENFYSYKYDEPYGLKLLHDVLKEQKGKDLKILSRSFSQDLSAATEKGNDIPTGQNYIFVGFEPFYTPKDAKALMEFVEAGNSVFISAYTLPPVILEQIKIYAEKGIFLFEPEEAAVDDYFSEDDDYQSEDDEFHETGSDTTYTEESVAEFSERAYFFRDLNNEGPIQPLMVFSLAFVEGKQQDRKLSFHAKYIKDTVQMWYPDVFSEHFLSDIKITPIIRTEANEGCIMLRAKVGQGTILLHTFPFAFTNYHLLREDGFLHAEGALSELNNGPVLWDNFSHRPQYEYPRSTYDGNNTPLSYILSKRSLAWAFYVILAMCILYLVLNTKRRQAPVPIAAPPVNTSLEFVQMVGQLYFNHKNNRELIRRMMQQFHVDIFAKYRIQERKPEVLIPKLIARIGVPEAEVRDIFSTYRRLEAQDYEPDDFDLSRFHSAIEDFHQKSK